MTNPRVLNRVADFHELREVYKEADLRICELKKFCERRKIPHSEYQILIFKIRKFDPLPCSSKNNQQIW